MRDVIRTADLPGRIMYDTVMGRIDSLTPQQTRVFELLSDGLSNKEIARMLGLHESTVKVHVSAILSKLDCPNRTTAALIALYHRLYPFLIVQDVAISQRERMPLCSIA